MNPTYDLAIIGGGINGCALARAAALAGYRVVLVERNDFGCGVTSRSTRLIHGGLRYLESGHVGLVRESLRERASLMQDYPHLVKPLEFVIPVYESDSRAPWWIQTGLRLYGFLARDGELGRHERLSRDELLSSEPGLARNGLRAGFLYRDCQVEFPERLALEMALEAEESGAAIHNHTAVTGFLLEDKRVAGVRVREGGDEKEVRARLTVNAAGPWVDKVRNLLPATDSEPLITLLNGAHIVVKPFPNAPKHALYHEARSNRRPFFVLPWFGLYLIGTTETPYEGDPGQAAPTEDETTYLLEEAAALLPEANLGRSDVLYSYAGPRPLLRVTGRNYNRASREHMVYDNEREEGRAGLLTLVGGKLTTARAFAEQVLEVVRKKTGGPAAVPRETTEHRSKPHAENVPGARLTSLYGARASRVQELAQQHPGWEDPVVSKADTRIAEIVYSIRHEKARTLGDLLLRRTGLAFHSQWDDSWVRATAAIAASHLSWDGSAVDEAIANYLAEERKTLVRP